MKPPCAGNTLDVESLRRDFPILGRKIHGFPYAYLDNAATALKPISVIEAMSRFYLDHYATIHRGVYTLSQEATVEYEKVRDQCRAFLNARESSEIIFVRGATEAINLVSFAFGRKFLKEGDEIILSGMEHHANIVPWQILAGEKRLILRIIPINDSGEILMEEYAKLLNEKTRLVAVTQMSNALGTINPVREMTLAAHERGAVVLVDGAQGAVHEAADVLEWGCDFYCFSGHKLYGPTGIGVLYGKKEHLLAMDPFLTGGEMIESVTFEKTSFSKPPSKFEAGTPPVAEVIGLGAALDYLKAADPEKIRAHEQDLTDYAVSKLLLIEGLKFIGQSKRRGPVISFSLDGIHPHDIGTLLDRKGIAIRTGHHCAQPVMQRFNVPATARVSFGLYNTRDEVDRLCQALRGVLEVFR